MDDPLDIINGMPTPAVEAERLKQRVLTLEREISAKTEKIKILESDLRVAQYTIKQLEDEAASTFKHFMEAEEGKKKGKRPMTKRKARPKKKNPKQGTPSHAAGAKASAHRSVKSKATSNNGTAGSAQAGSRATKLPEPEEGDEITYDLIARHFPDMKLSTVLRAEEVFRQADIDGNGQIDVTELDKWLTKQDLIFSVNQVTALLLDMDINKDDSIDFFEYIGLLHVLEDTEQFKERQEKLAPTTSAALTSIRTTLRGSNQAQPSPSPSAPTTAGNASNQANSNVCSIQ